MAEVINDPIFAKAALSRVVGRMDQLPQDKKWQVLFAGKSNAGKSSLINKLCRQKRLARTSASAGKTRQLIFFDLADAFYLVDLPGYGFAQASQAQKEAFNALTEAYLQSKPPIALICHIMDIRHLPGKKDMAMIAWLEATGYPYLLLLNKADKLGRSRRQQEAAKIGRHIQAALGHRVESLTISATEGLGLAILSEKILAEVHRAKIEAQR